jgi:hypothetical protein
MSIYYTGLIKANRNNTIIGKMDPVEVSFREIKKDAGDLKTYTGTINMEDYMALKPMKLHCKVHVKSCPEEKKTLIFYELSPQSLSHKLWLNLDKLWLDFRCRK